MAPPLLGGYRGICRSILPRRARFALHCARSSGTFVNQPTAHVVLVNPEIPQNTGNIGRLVLCAGATLSLVGSLGFDISEKAVRRAGLDYWKNVPLHREPSVDAFFARIPAERCFFLSKRGRLALQDVDFPAEPYVIFGGESKGLPADLYDRYEERSVYVPTTDNVRSLNLANCASVVLYHILYRQGLLSTLGRGAPG